jgi:hypothetical protein
MLPTELSIPNLTNINKMNNSLLHQFTKHIKTIPCASGNPDSIGDPVLEKG